MDARDFFGYKHQDEEPGRRPEDEDSADGERPPQFEEAITLDDPAVIARIDVSGHAGRVRELPRQLTPGAPRGGRRGAGRSGTATWTRCWCWGWAAPPSGRSWSLGWPATDCACRSSCIVTTGCRRGPVTERWSSRPATRARRSRRCPARRGATPWPAAGRGIAPAARSAARPEATGRRSCATRQPGQPRAAIGFGVGPDPRAAGRRAGLLIEPDPLGPAVEALEAHAGAQRASGRDGCQPGQAAGVVDVRAHPRSSSARARWPRSRTAGRRS